MNQTNLSRLILPVLFVPLAVFAMLQVLTQGGNQLGNTFFMLTLLGAAMGLFTAKAGLLLFFVLQFYLDLFKRLMILGDSLSSQDVMISLSIGPAIIVTACITSASRCFFGKVPFLNQRDLTFLGGCVAVSLLGLFLGQGGISSGSVTELGQSLLGTSMLGMTAFATYVIIQDRKDQYKVLVFTVIGAIPMALYTFYQSFHGISHWEEEYIRTGISKVLYNFYLLDGIDEMRPFSTLNTHTSLGAVSATMFLVATLLMMNAKRLLGSLGNFRLFYVVAACIFLGSCYLSKNRTTYAMPLLGFFLVFAFSSGKRTLLFYGSAIAVFVWVVINSEWLNNSILAWSADLEGTAFGKAFGSLGTYQARLASFIQLTSPESWTPFGLDNRERPEAHDQITETLLKIGYVPLFAMLLVGGSFVFWWHRRCLKTHHLADRSFLISLTAIIVSMGVCGLAYGNMLFVAPVNSLLGAMIGLGMATIRRDQVESKVRAIAGPVDPAIPKVTTAEKSKRQRAYPKAASQGAPFSP